MKCLFIIILIFSSLPIFSQGVEMYGGYHARIPSQKGNDKLSNLANGQAGVNFNIYIRSVSVQFGGGYMSDNYTISYAKTYGGISPSKGLVNKNYVYIPLMIYPKIYADGKNVLSVGAGGNFMVPFVKNATVEYEDGSTRKATLGNFRPTITPRLAVRYARFMGKSFVFFTNIYSDITIMNEYVQASPGHGPTIPVGIPYYDSRFTMGVNVGLSYILPIDGMAKPRYFQKRLHKKMEK